MSKKPRKYWFRNKKVVALRKDLKSLKRQKKDLMNQVQEVINQYNANASQVTEAADWLEKLPLETIQELYSFLAGESNFNLQTLVKRSKLRKEHLQKIDEVKQLDNKITEVQIDLVIAQIECMEKGISEENNGKV